MAKKEDLKVGMEVYFCEPDLTSGRMKIVSFETEGNTTWAVGDWGYVVPVDFCTPVKCDDAQKRVCNRRYTIKAKELNVGYIIDYKGQEYIASIKIRADLGYRSEFAIFKSQGGQFTIDDALPLYRKEDVEFSYDALDKCIDEFIDSIEKSQS